MFWAALESEIQWSLFRLWAGFVLVDVGVFVTCECGTVVFHVLLIHGPVFWYKQATTTALRCGRYTSRSVSHVITATVSSGVADNSNWLAVVLFSCGLDSRESAFDSSQLFMGWCIIIPLKFRVNYMYHLLYC